MQRPGRPGRTSGAPRRCASRLAPSLAALLVASAAAAGTEPFIFSGDPVHPGCVHALVMQSGDRVPVTTAVSLPGCAASTRSLAPLKFDKDLVYIEDPALTGGRSFGYRHIATLDNGIYVLGVERVALDGQEEESLAAMAIVRRPAVRRNGEVGERLELEMVGEVRLPDLHLTSISVVGNKVHFSAGLGASRIDRSIDLSRIGKKLR
jgi:hypothetical protein